jgi:hypothetical protein
MASKGKKSVPRKGAADLDTGKMWAVINVLTTESDRGCTLSGATLVEDALELALRARFRAASGLHIASAGSAGRCIRRLLFEGTLPPLGSFGVKTELCRALGILDGQTASALDEFRRMRNKAAHVSDAFSLDEAVVEAMYWVLSDDRRGHVDRLLKGSREPARETSGDKRDRRLRARFAAVTVYLHLQITEPDTAEASEATV